MLGVAILDQYREPVTLNLSTVKGGSRLPASREYWDARRPERIQRVVSDCERLVDSG
jgi:hypothetical protein